MNTAASIPAGDYRREFAYLFAALAAATQTADTTQQDDMRRHLVPLFTRIRNNITAAATNTGTRAQVANDIAEAQQTLRRIMGANWKPPANSDVGQAVLQRGHNPRTLLA